MDGVDGDVRLIDRDVGAAGEGQAIEPVGGIEDAIFQHAVQLEIGFYLILVEVVFRLADLRGVMVPVPGFQVEMIAALVDLGLDFGGFTLLLGRGGAGQLLHEA